MWTDRPERELARRCAVFVRAGLLDTLPTRWQLMQGTWEMTPWVLSPDATSEASYRKSLWAHPVVRQPFLVRVIGLDHLSTGTGLRVRLRSVCRHLQLTWHEGMPVFDLQLAQTHPDGLEVLRRSTAALRDPRTPEERRVRRQAQRLFPDPDAYFGRFLDPGGWIDRAAAFDYSEPDEDGSVMPPEFHGLVPFLRYCTTLPRVPEGGWRTGPAVLARRLGRRRRERLHRSR